jgi:hypothetical protein
LTKLHRRAIGDLWSKKIECENSGA